MLKAKFDGSFDSLPATYIWSRLVRMKSTRTGAQQKEMAGHLIGGYQTLLEAMADRIRATGGKIYLNTPVEEIMIHNNIAWGLREGGQGIPFDVIVATPQTPIFLRLIPDADPEYRKELEKIEYLGILAMLLVMDRPLSDYWTMYITNDSCPFTGIIETTSYIDPVYVGGHHLVYLPKYVSKHSEWFRLDDDTIRERWLGELQQMFPAFQPEWIRYCLIHRERYVEPIRNIHGAGITPAIETPVAGLYLATTTQIYPQLTNGESVSIHAQSVCDLLMEQSSERDHSMKAITV
jgi:protoporphyrinogen oxidase